MLTALSVRNIVLIDALDASFEAGLCALTGETGAGKSILLGALGLAAGERADRAQVGNLSDEGRAAATFDISPDHSLHSLLSEAGIAAEPGEALILRRRVTADGRSQGWINDQPASIGLVRQIGDLLVEVHGQHDGRGLLDPKTHRGLLDAFAGNHSERAAVGDAWQQLAAARDRLDSLRATQASANEQEAYLRQSLEDLDALEPVKGEEAGLAEERKFLQNAEQALAELEEARQSLDADGGLSARLNAALRGMEKVRASLGEGEAGTAGAARTALERATSALDRALIEFTEAEEALADAASTFEIEPGRLNEVEERLFGLRAAARKHDVTVDDLPELRSNLADKLEAIEHADDRVREAEKAVAGAEAAYDSAAVRLTKSREKAAGDLARAVMAELPPLKLEKAQFRVAIESGPDRAGANGRDRVAFEVMTNPGTPFGPLDKIASGGELSRFALAIKVSLSSGEDGLTLIFDEVDQGVGGAVAAAVGKRLKRLAETGQTLVVTHSPQVAAMADHHWKIEKAEDGEGRVRTTLRPLSGAERREEIARMLSGENVTDAARAQADELMAG
ncbi:DNA repair protein RecN [Hyphobacterium sp. HN65]|uniref:DNA repair protein RecN n=1 Tax=Hyphobacterium lacteum TaxID=3116575 RepID=A0ABU7LQY3_9PROT|nr:DNA repair protein RecN [Hyphobacterium sp. HN65]MEE2526312.1 DNA repair protein RecN [Hyphobacterium sp. HN65]